MSIVGWILGGARCGLVVAAMALGMFASAAAAEDPPVSGTVSDVVINFQPSDHSALPSPEELGRTSFTLWRRGSDLFAGTEAPAGSDPIEIAIKDLRGYRLSAAATDQMQQAIVQRINEAGIGSVAARIVPPAANQRGSAVVNIVVGTVAGVRALSMDEEGDRPRSADAIERRSPVQLGGDEPPLLTVKAIDEFLARLNRIPGRNVSASISAGEQPGTLMLDYLVGKEKNVSVYAQISNTGTSATSRLLERFGILVTQLNRNDDILSIEGMSGNLEDATRSLSAFYEAPIGSREDLRWRLTANWGDYTAADVGFLRQEFTGSTTGIQGDLIWNIHQDDSFFLDLDAGFRYWNSKAENRFFGFLLADGNSDFVTATLSLNAFEMQPTSSLQASLGIEHTKATANQITLDELGRLNTSTDWWVLFASGHYSFYMDPLIDPAWKDEAIRPLVHEITLRGQGQYAFGERLTPTAMSAMGGYATVRGYPQSAVSGDSTLQGSLEYRLHLPRMFDAQTAGRGWIGDKFRWRTDSMTGAPPDWDLALVAFVDAGQIWQSDRLGFETDETLVGAGIGAELRIRQNASLTLNYGWALHELEAAGVDEGSARLHFLGSISF